MAFNKDLVDSLSIDEDQRSHTSGKGRLWFGVPIVFLLAFLIVFIMRNGEDKQDSSDGHSTSSNVELSAQTDTANSQISAPRYCQRLDLTGYIEARKMANLSSSVFGVIDEVYFDEGDTVKNGDLIAQLDDEKAHHDFLLNEAAHKQLMLQKKTLEINYREQRKELKRYTALKQNDFIDQTRLDQMEKEKEILEIQLLQSDVEIEQARLQVEKSKKILEDHRIYAPFDGVLTTLNAKRGEVIAPSAAGGGLTRTGVGTIVDMDSLEVVVDISENFIRSVQEGAAVSVEVHAYKGEVMNAEIHRIIPMADRGKATVKVRIKLLEKHIRVMPGMAVIVHYENPVGDQSCAG